MRRSWRRARRDWTIDVTAPRQVLSPKADDISSTAPWSFGLALLGIAVAVMILGAIFPEFFDSGLNQSGLGFP